MANGLSIDGLPNESHGHQLQEHYQQILADLLKRIADAVNAIGDLGLEPNQKRDIRIFIGGREVQENEITEAQVEKLRRAIEDPSSLKKPPYKGVVEIKVDGERVFRNQYGKVVPDKLELLKSQKQELKTNQVIEQANISQTKQHQQSSITQEPATALEQANNAPAEANISQPKQLKIEEQLHEITSLKQAIEQQTQRIESLEKKLDLISKSVNSVQNKSLSKWLGSTISNTVSGLGQRVDKWTNERLEDLQRIYQEPQPTRSIRYFDELDHDQEIQPVASSKDIIQQSSELQQQLKALENKIQITKTTFEQSMADVQKALEPAIHRALDYLEPIIYNALERADPVIERAIDNVTPVIKTISERSGIRQRFETSSVPTQSKNSVVEGVVGQVTQSRVADENFKANMVLTSVEKLLERIPSQTKQGIRSFQTGSGHLFEQKGDTLTIYAPDKSELVRSVGKTQERKITISPHFSSENATQLEKIGKKINQVLSTKLAQSQSQTQEQKVVKGRVIS